MRSVASYGRIRGALIALAARKHMLLHWNRVRAFFAMHDASKPLRVFIVEDSPLVRDRLDAGIAAVGGIVVGHSEAANDAIENLATVDPDVVIIDIQLRSGTGFDV